MKPSLNCAKLLWGVLIIVYGYGLVYAADDVEVRKAFDHFTATPRDPWPIYVGDGERLAVLRANPEQVKSLMIPALSKGSSFSRDQLNGVLSLLPVTTKLEILREVAKTYPIDDMDFPYGTAIVTIGTSQDVEYVLERLRRLPADSSRVAGITAYMAECDNPAAHQALVGFAASMPGTWMNDPAVKKVLERLGGPKPPATGAGTTDVIPASSLTAPLSTVVSGETPGVAGNTPIATASDSRWLWGLAGLGAIVAVIFALRRRAKG